jgi:hypothetical protein
MQDRRGAHSRTSMCETVKATTQNENRPAVLRFNQKGTLHPSPIRASSASSSFRNGTNRFKEGSPLGEIQNHRSTCPSCPYLIHEKENRRGGWRVTSRKTGEVGGGLHHASWGSRSRCSAFPRALPPELQRFVSAWQQRSVVPFLKKMHLTCGDEIQQVE